MELGDDKSNLTVTDGPSDQDGFEGAADEKKGTAADRADMYRLGKTQELRVCACFPSPYLCHFCMCFGKLTAFVIRETSDSCPYSASP